LYTLNEHRRRLLSTKQMNAMIKLIHVEDDATVLADERLNPSVPSLHQVSKSLYKSLQVSTSLYKSSLLAENAERPNSFVFPRLVVA